MIKKSLMVASAAAILLMSGCSSKSMTISGGGAPLEGMTACAKYEIVGDAVGTASGSQFLFFSIGGDNSSGTIGGGSGRPEVPDPVKNSAIYHAIESVEGADAIIAPRFTQSKKGIPLLFSTRTVTVKGKAIKYSAAECRMK